MRQWIDLFEKLHAIYRDHTRKPLAQLSVDDLKAALTHDVDGIAGTVVERITDWMDHSDRRPVEEILDAELAEIARVAQHQLAKYIVGGRIAIYREVVLTQPSDLRKQDLGACWTPNPDSARAYNASHNDGEPYLISAWIADQDVDWGATAILRFNDEEEDEIRIFSSGDVHYLNIAQRQ